jgi:hypothetical protein
MSPRLTTAMLKHTESIAKTFYSLFVAYEDTDISSAFSLWAYVILKRLGIPHPIRSELEEALGPDRVFRMKGATIPATEEELRLTLLDMIKAKRPDFYDTIGTHKQAFQHWLLFALSVTAPDVATKQKITDYLEQIRRPSYELDHLPGNPITVERDSVTGKHTLADVDNAEPKHYMQIKAYFDSLRPARRVGRPKLQIGDQPVKQEKSNRSVSSKEALAVYHAKGKGQNWQQIALKVLHTPIPSDPQARERLRVRVYYLAAAGDRLHRKNL